MPLPEDKTAQELGFKVGDQFRVVSEECWFAVGDTVTLSKDDRTDCPWFKDAHGEENPCYFSELDPLDKPVTASPQAFKVGDHVRLKSTNGKGSRYVYGSVGMTGLITEVERRSNRDVEVNLDGKTDVFCSEDLELLYRPCPDHSPGLCCCDLTGEDLPHHQNCK